MTNIIRVPSASSPPTTNSGFAEAVRQQLSPVPATRGLSLVFVGPVAALPPVSAGFVDIDTLVAELEQDPALKAAIADGRAALAEPIYGGEGPRPLSFYRLRKGWSQKELSHRMRTSQSYIARLETGGIDPQISTFCRLAEVLDVPPEELLKALTHKGAKP
jgi:DNA-binding XRE family transcriptional regulator